MFKKNELSFLNGLISSKSIAPEDDGAIDKIIHFLGNEFTCHKVIFGPEKERITNLYAEFGNGSKNLCFAGHTDVVPPGDINKWMFNPFELNIHQGLAYGRGMVDMKGAIFSFILALKDFIKNNHNVNNYKISLLISGSEEGDAKYGTESLIQWLQTKRITIHDCIVGEPTSVSTVGDTIKIGRRGSITFFLKIIGKQGHVAYPQNAHNPISDLVKILYDLNQYQIDNGNNYFEKSNLEITTIDVGNNTTNVIPANATAIFNIRNNNCVESLEIINHVKRVIDKTTNNYELRIDESAKAFITKSTNFAEILKESVLKIKPNINPEFSTSGGTSDARFLKDITNIAELGLLNKTAHHIDENCSLHDLNELRKIYKKLLDLYFC